MSIVEKAVATHFSTLAWQIPRTEECGRLRFLELDKTERLHFHFSLSCIGEGNGNPLQCSCLENLRDGRAWWAAIYGVSQSRTRLIQLSSSSSISIEPVMPSSHLIFYLPLLLLPSVFPSIRVSQLFASGGQCFGVSASASVLPVNIQDCFPLGLTDWISLKSKGLSRVSPTPQFKSISSLALSFLYGPTLTSIHDYWKSHSFD